MHRTQEVQKEREKALEELGITVEKNNVGVHTPKKVGIINSFTVATITHSLSFSFSKMPHLVNLV